MPSRTTRIFAYIALILLLLVVFSVRRQQRFSQPSQSQSNSEGNSAGESNLYRPTERPRRNDSGNASRTNGGTGASCALLAVTCDSGYFASWHEPRDETCTATTKNGLQIPDPVCTPGGINPSVTLETLRNSQWRTDCIRNCKTSEAKKRLAYAWYKTGRPRGNFGTNQLCELDHLVPLELGGADGMGNIWPECGPNGAVLKDRYFKIKDRVEEYLAEEVRAGRIPLEAAQRGIAADWTQYVTAANTHCVTNGRC